MDKMTFIKMLEEATGMNFINDERFWERVAEEESIDADADQ